MTSQINEKPFSNIEIQYIVNTPQIKFAVVGVEYVEKYFSCHKYSINKINFQILLQNSLHFFCFVNFVSEN